MIATQHAVQIKQGTAARVGTFSLAFATSDLTSFKTQGTSAGVSVARKRLPGVERPAPSGGGHLDIRQGPRSAAKMAPLLRGCGGWWTQSSGEANSPCRSAQIRTPDAPPMWTPCHEKISWSSYNKFWRQSEFECISRFMHLLGIVAPSFKRWCAQCWDMLLHCCPAFQQVNVFACRNNQIFWLFKMVQTCFEIKVWNQGRCYMCQLFREMALKSFQKSPDVEFWDAKPLAACDFLPPLSRPMFS